MNLAWDKTPLIPVVVQNAQDSVVLMLAYVNKEALQKSIESGVAHYFSRSKNRIWKKGEESGNIQKIKEIRLDCDCDALIFVVEQVGVACHTGNFSCFFNTLEQNLALDSALSQERKKPSYHILDELYHVLQEKKYAPQTHSYTASLYEKGENEIGKKIAEEAAEFAFALKDKNQGEIIHECADLIYHVLVGLSFCNVSPDSVMCELKRRFGTSGITEKRNRKNVPKQNTAQGDESI